MRKRAIERGKTHLNTRFAHFRQFLVSLKSEVACFGNYQAEIDRDRER